MKAESRHRLNLRTAIAGFFITAVIGWMLGAETPATADKNDLNPPTVTRSLRPRHLPRTSGITAEAEQRLAVIRDAPNDTERMRATIGLANSLPPSEFESWLSGGWFNIRDGADFMLFTTLIRERWMAEDPEGFALWCSKDRSSRNASEVFSQFMETEPLRAFAFFKQHPDTRAELSAMAAMAKDHPDLALQRLQEMNDDGIVGDIDYYANELFDILAENSQAAFESLLVSLKEPLKFRAEMALISARLKTDFASEIRKLWDRPHGYKIYESAIRNLEGGRGQIFDELANLPPAWRDSIAGMSSYYVDEDNAEKWWNADLPGLGFTPNQELMIRTKALQKMAAHQPEEALELMESFDFPPQEGDADGSDRRWEVIASAISANPEKTEQIIAGLALEVDRKNAQKILERMKVRDQEDSAKKIESPEQWLDKAATIAPAAHYTFGATLRNWPHGKLIQMAEQFHAMPADEKQKVAPVLASGISSSNFNPPLAGDAIRHLLNQPSTEPPDPDSTTTPWLNSAVNYTANLAINDPESGCEWVESLPDGETKLWSQVNLHSIWKTYDPLAADQWLKSLPTETQSQLKALSKKSRE